MKTYKGLITKLTPNQCFVFGSNTEGRHGAGAALQAMKFGAIYGRAGGPQGQTYAIITKDLNKPVHPSVPQDHIKMQIRALYQYANERDDLDFLVAYSGKGKNLNGYTPLQMAQMFAAFDFIPTNIVFEESFAEIIKSIIK